MPQTARKTKPPASPSLRDAVIACRAEDETIEGSAKLLLDMAKGNPEMYRELMGHYEWAAAVRMMRSHVHHSRSKIWHSPAAASATARVGSLVRVNATALLDFPLPGGLMLRNAGAAELTAAIGGFLKQATDMRAKGTWLRRIAAKLPEGKTVGEAFTEDQLWELKQPK